mmetsp:Transcript_27693/g.64025  ORF Transcript_27693/g.64025 Transcript_27693/m.64025 type:complete len:90 (+) Transcript_27693:898-1167(+)
MLAATVRSASLRTDTSMERVHRALRAPSVSDAIAATTSYLGRSASQDQRGMLGDGQLVRIKRAKWETQALKMMAIEPYALPSAPVIDLL